MFTSPDLLVLNQREAEQTQSFKDQESMRRWLGGGCRWQKRCYELNTNLSQAIKLPYQHPGVYVHDLSMYAHRNQNWCCIWWIVRTLSVFTQTRAHIWNMAFIYTERKVIPGLVYCFWLICHVFAQAQWCSSCLEFWKLICSFGGVEVTPQNAHIVPHRCFSHLTLRQTSVWLNKWCQQDADISMAVLNTVTLF